jgi:hypothetical protein
VFRERESDELERESEWESEESECEWRGAGDSYSLEMVIGVLTSGTTRAAVKTTHCCACCVLAENCIFMHMQFSN